MRRFILNFLFLAACLGCAFSQPALARRPAVYTNPVVDADFPDPTVIRAADGYYYAYGTQSERNGLMVNIQVARSNDLRHWRYLGDALPQKPLWAAKTQDFWAPHVQRDGFRYFMYFSAKPDTALVDSKLGLCLAVATATSPRGPFKDMGYPLKCGEGFVNIDPMAFDDPATGKHLLYWGSGFQPIKVQELGPDRMSFASGSTSKDLIWPSRVKAAGSFPQLVEGSWVVRHGGQYYLFYSGDNCCGAKANYAVMVARSNRATGPFETLEQCTGAPHSIILAKNGRWIAPGHNSIVSDASGQDWIVYHAVDAGRTRVKETDNPNTRRVMLMDHIVWRNGWPMSIDPSSSPRRAPRTDVVRNF